MNTDYRKTAASNSMLKNVSWVLRRRCAAAARFMIVDTAAKWL